MKKCLRTRSNISFRAWESAFVNLIKEVFVNILFHCAIQTCFPVTLCLYLLIRFICHDIRICTTAHNPCGFTYSQGVWKLKRFSLITRSERCNQVFNLSYSKLLKYIEVTLSWHNSTQVLFSVNVIPALCYWAQNQCDLCSISSKKL